MIPPRWEDIYVRITKAFPGQFAEFYHRTMIHMLSMVQDGYYKWDTDEKGVRYEQRSDV